MNVDDLNDLDDETRKKIEELQKITRERDGGKVFAESQLEMFNLIRALNLCDVGIEVLKKIRLEDSAFHYQYAQLFLSILYFYRKDDLDSAYKAIINFKSEDSESKSSISYEIAEAFLNRSEDSEDIAKAQKLLIHCVSTHSYESYCCNKICDLLLGSSSKAIGKRLLKLLKRTLEIVEILKLYFSQESIEEKPPERKLAHYTNTSITNILLEIDENNVLPSSFRLNTINNVNDPSEGHLLINYLKGMRENSFYAPDFNGDLHAFISCFTFNHDSLNQFRLYGKESDKEASGVSLVFKKEFFQLNNALGGLSFLSLDNKLQNTNEVLADSKNDRKLDVGDNPNNTRISKQPVMRCVYIDPTSNYVQLAQRNRITFFREFSDETVRIKDVETSKAEHEWKEYKEYIEAKTKSFNVAFIDLKTIYKSIIEGKVEIDKDDSELFNDISVLTDEILLPLKYLIKHSAFQEEQECRMVYVTSIKAPEVKIVDKKFLFVEYESEVKENLNKVYIAPAATKYQLYLTWLLRDENVKIELSNNPYRQT